MPQPNDLSRSLVALDQDSTIIAFVEMSQSSWLVAGVLPGIERQPRKKLEPSAERLLGLLLRWRDEAVRAGKKITRIALAFEAGRDGFWLARWLSARGVEAHVIHPSSVAVSREHRRAKTDRLDTELLKRAFLGWLRGERGHCSMARVPTMAEEDAKRPNRERGCLVGERTRIVNRMKATLARLGIRNFKPTLRKAAERLATLHTPEGIPLPPNGLAELQRDMARLGFVISQIKEIEEARQKRLEQEPESGPHAMVRHLARVVGVGVETADMLVHEVLSRPMRDRKAVARYAGLTGSPDESGAKRREQGLARAGNARVRRGMIQLAWRFLRFQKESALAQWYQARTADSRVGTRKTMIVALARKLLIALWRFVTTGETLEGVILRPVAKASGKSIFYLFGARAGVQGGLPIDDPRWREPADDRAEMPTERMGPPPGALPPMRMTASWSGSKRTYRIQVCGAKTRPNGELPSDHYADRRRETPELRRKAHLMFGWELHCLPFKACKVRPASSRTPMAASRCLGGRARDAPPLRRNSLVLSNRDY